jgi:dTDP-4-amino-4,6-dideoxygalactose transaminase
MALPGSVPRRSVNLPPGALGTLVGCALSGRAQEGPQVAAFEQRFAEWLNAPHVLSASTGRSAFQLGLSALNLEPGGEIIFPVFTFPVMPLVAKMLGFIPVFCDVDPSTYNARPEHIAACLTERTAGVLATHLFGRPCEIDPIADLCRERKIRLMEDCAHACGVRVHGQQVGTFGDLGVFSFAEGKNMPCFGGGAIAVRDDAVAARAREILAGAVVPTSGAAIKQGVDIWIKWFLTRPFIFRLSAYPALRWKLATGKPLMDSAVGDDLLERFARSNPRVERMVNLQAATGLRQLNHIDAFNDGARRNAGILTRHLGEVAGVRAPATTNEDHIYVYYPLAVDPSRRDDLRHYLLRHGIDTKITDMSDCSQLAPFRDGQQRSEPEARPREASLLEICVYPVLPQARMVHIARTIRAWASLPPL